MESTSKSAWTKKLDAVEEFERTPVPEHKLKGAASFWGMYAGEHIAGTEFVIGPLFVAHGVGARDLVSGLLLGNVLAVLSWAFICAPIATKSRSTLYYQLEKICGPRLALVYNVVNALMFCFLAGSMIAVSATAVGIPFKMTMPSLNDFYPNSIGWIVAVLGIGAATTIVAMFGYTQVARFANYAVPWMILMFIAAPIAVLPNLGIHSFSEFWPVANEKIWTGIPLAGQSKFTFWHVMFFAWFCNLAMHIGMSDLSILRYARKWHYGFSTSIGMFVGHYIAWLASGILYALFLLESNQSMEFAPGPIAYRAAGFAGVVCVIAAGWTTANPTIYRAGLALQALMPGSKTWKVTMIIGLVTTLAACFPALVMKLLDFVALYGLILMPMGAVIFSDFWLLPKLSLKQDYAEWQQIIFSWPAALTWGVTLLISFLLPVELFFKALPGWFIAIGLYTSLAYVQQRVHSKALAGAKI
ncbi:MAG: purine-cytosine permease family protein [bacterium]